MELNNWSAVLLESFQDLWFQVAQILPNLIVAIIILALGWVIGSLFGKLIARFVSALKVDDALARAGVRTFVERSGYSLNAGAFLGALVKWFIFAVFLVAAFDVLGMHQVNAFLHEVVLGFLPQVIVAVIILLVAALLADVVQNAVTAAARGANLRSAAFLGTAARTAIWVFASFAALNQLGVAQEFLQILFTGIVIALALAIGLAFGLGGREEAARILANAREGLTSKR
jgi:hypothetical protein